MIAILLLAWSGPLLSDAPRSFDVNNPDITPTFIDVAGGQPRQHLDGVSYLNVLTGATDRHKTHTFALMTTRGIINGVD